MTIKGDEKVPRQNHLDMLGMCLQVKSKPDFWWIFVNFLYFHFLKDKTLIKRGLWIAILYLNLIKVMLGNFPKDFIPRGNFPRAFSQVATSQLCNLPNNNISQVSPSRSAHTSLFQPQRSSRQPILVAALGPTTMQPTVPQRA